MEEKSRLPKDVQSLTDKLIHRKTNGYWQWVASCDTEFHVIRTYEELDYINPAHLKFRRREGNLRNLSPNVEPQDTCRRGHPWTPENTYYFRNTRQCRKCNSIRTSAKITEKFNKQCKREHVHIPENTRVGPTGRKICLLCERERLCGRKEPHSP